MLPRRVKWALLAAALAAAAGAFTEPLILRFGTPIPVSVTAVYAARTDVFAASRASLKRRTAIQIAGPDGPMDLDVPASLHRRLAPGDILIARYPRFAPSLLVLEPGQ